MKDYFQSSITQHVFTVKDNVLPVSDCQEGHDAERTLK